MNGKTTTAIGVTADITTEGASFVRFVRLLQTTIGIAIAMTVGGLYLADELHPLRIGFSSLIGASLLMSVWALRSGGPVAAVNVIAAGIWSVNALTVVSFAGVHSANMVIFPFVIALGGWIKGARWMLGYTVATIVLVLGLGIGEHLGLYHPTPRAGPMLATLMIAGTLIVISLLTYVAHGSYERSRDRAIESSELMALHNITLAAREHEMQMIMDNVPAAISAFNADGRLRMGNARYATLFGKTPDELQGKHISEYLAPEALEVLAEPWRRCLQGEPSGYRRFHRDPANGELRIFDVNLVPDTQHGRIEGLFALMLDVTDKVQAEAALRELNESLEHKVSERTRELERSTERLRRSQDELAKSEAKAAIAALVASVSHELSTPIGNGVMTASTLADQANEFIRNVEAGHLKRSELTGFVTNLRAGTDLLLRNLARARDLLLNFKQVAADQASEQRREFDLAEVLGEVVATMAPSLKARPQQIELEVAPDIRMDSYPGPLGQLLINLINNAYLHAFEGRDQGSLRIRATANDATVTLVVEDDGIGMSHETLTQLFQPFFSTKIGKGGTGLGMSIVEGIVRKTLGGTLHVSSEPGKGTRFDISIPVTAP